MGSATKKTALIGGIAAVGLLVAVGVGRGLNVRSSAPPSDPSVHGLLLVDTARNPSIVISSGGRASERKVPFTAPNDPVELTEGLTGYASLGGIRLETGQGHPRGAIVRFGFTRAAGGFFVEHGTTEELRLELGGVVFNTPVKIDEGSLLVHLRLDAAGGDACGLEDRDRAWLLTASEQESLGGRLTDGRDAHIGALQDAEVEFTVDGSEVGIALSLPAIMLKHPRDPWRLETPGGFWEPEHLHVEFEVLPVDAEPRVLTESPD